MHGATIKIVHRSVGTYIAVLAEKSKYSSLPPFHVIRLAGRPARPRKQHDYHHDTKVKPEAVTAVIELLMMGKKTPVTC
jgi:hypothetical protein